MARAPATPRPHSALGGCIMRTVGAVLVLWCYASAASGAAARRREYEPYVFAAVPLHAPVPVLHVLSPAPLARAPAAVGRPYPSLRPYAAESRPYPSLRPYAADDRPHATGRPYAESHGFAESRPAARVRPYPAPYESAEYEEAASAEIRGAARRPPEYEYSLQVLAPRAVRPAPAALALDALDSEESSREAPAVLYARPSLSGGYTYRKISGKKAPPKKVTSSKEAPVIIKIHKHRITKS